MVACNTSKLSLVDLNFDTAELKGDGCDVTHCENFEADGCRVQFCVKRVPEHTSSQPRYEVQVQCSLGATGGAEAADLAAGGERRPVLLWDVDTSLSFDWEPPEYLPLTDGTHEKDRARRCVVTRFKAPAGFELTWPPTSPGTWRLTLVWPCGSAPRRLLAQIQLHDRPVVRPGHSRCFVVPLREETIPGDGLRLSRCASSIPVPRWACLQQKTPPSPECVEALSELGRQRASFEQTHTSLTDKQKQLQELQEKINATGPHMLLQSHLTQERKTSREIRAELAEFAGRPQFLCFVDGKDNGNLECSRTELSATWADQRFQVDEVFSRDGFGKSVESGHEFPRSFGNLAATELIPAFGSNASNCLIVVVCGGFCDRAEFADNLLRCLCETLAAKPSNVSKTSWSGTLALVEVAAGGHMHDLLQSNRPSTSVETASRFTALRNLSVEEIVTQYQSARETVVNGHSIVASICGSLGGNQGVHRFVIITTVGPAEPPTMPNGASSVGQDHPTNDNDAVIEAGMSLAAIAKGPARSCLSAVCIAPDGCSEAVGHVRTAVLVHASGAPMWQGQTLDSLRLASAAASALRDVEVKQDDTGPTERQVERRLLQENARLRAAIGGGPARQSSASPRPRRQCDQDSFTPCRSTPGRRSFGLGRSPGLDSLCSDAPSPRSDRPTPRTSRAAGRKISFSGGLFPCTASKENFTPENRKTSHQGKIQFFAQ